VRCLCLRVCSLARGPRLQPTFVISQPNFPFRRRSAKSSAIERAASRTCRYQDIVYLTPYTSLRDTVWHCSQEGTRTTSSHGTVALKTESTMEISHRIRAQYMYAYRRRYPKLMFTSCWQAQPKLLDACSSYSYYLLQDNRVFILHGTVTFSSSKATCISRVDASALQLCCLRLFHPGGHARPSPQTSPLIHRLLKKQYASLEPPDVARDSCSTALDMEPAVGVLSIAPSDTCS
jgi:hypothetical protein